MISRITTAIFTLPSLEDWGISLSLLGLYALIALPVGFWGNFLFFSFPALSWRIGKVILLTLVMPAIVEELIFRVILLPHPSTSPPFSTQLFWGVFSLILFVIYHPFNGFTFYPEGRDTFINPVFLFLATLLGIICTLSYWQSGSLWTPVILHWWVVAVWLLLLGGEKELSMNLTTRNNSS